MTTSAGDALSRVRAAYRSPFALAREAQDTPLLLGLSGGADSRLLLHLVAEECKSTGAPLHLCHVHHGIRGDEADRDEQFCRALAEEYGLPFHAYHQDVPTLARERGESIETVARKVRYDCFARVMQEENIPLLLTAHNADDNLETMLFHLIRGCATGGLGGIAPARPLDDTTHWVVRPLLACSKEDIVAACHALGLSYVTDSTNEDTAYTRNFLRARVLPTLSQVVPHPELQVTRVSETLREDDECLGNYAEVLMNVASADQKLRRSVLATAHPALAKRVLRRWVEEQSGQPLAFCHLEALMQLCEKDATSKQTCVPGGVVIAERELLSFQAEANTSKHPNAFDLPFAVGTFDYPELGFRICVNAECEGQHQTVTQNDKNVYNPFIRDTLIFDTIVGCQSLDALHWRNRQAGDSLLLRGVNRRLRKLQNEVGLPLALRDRLPLLCLGDTVLWAPFAGARDGAFSSDPQTVHTAYRLIVEWRTTIQDNQQEDLS